jgi:hypothetical protein
MHKVTPCEKSNRRRDGVRSHGSSWCSALQPVKPIDEFAQRLVRRSVTVARAARVASAVLSCLTMMNEGFDRRPIVCCLERVLLPVPGEAERIAAPTHSTDRLAAITGD